MEILRPLASRRCEVKKMDCEEALPVKIAIDMSYESFMDERVCNSYMKCITDDRAIDMISCVVFFEKHLSNIVFYFVQYSCKITNLLNF